MIFQLHMEINTLHRNQSIIKSDCLTQSKYIKIYTHRASFKKYKEWGFYPWSREDSSFYRGKLVTNFYSKFLGIRILIIIIMGNSLHKNTLHLRISDTHWIQRHYVGHINKISGSIPCSKLIGQPTPYHEHIFSGWVCVWRNKHTYTPPTTEIHPSPSPQHTL